MIFKLPPDLLPSDSGMKIISYLPQAKKVQTTSSFSNPAASWMQIVGTPGEMQVLEDQHSVLAMHINFLQQSWELGASL